MLTTTGASRSAPIGEPCLLRAVDGHQHARGRVLRQRAEQPPLLQLEEPVLARQRRRPDEHHDAVLAELHEREVHREQRPERVPVGVLV